MIFISVSRRLTRFAAVAFSFINNEGADAVLAPFLRFADPDTACPGEQAEEDEEADYADKTSQHDPLLF